MELMCDASKSIKALMVLPVCGNNFRIISCDFMVGLESVFQESGVLLFAKKKNAF